MNATLEAINPVQADGVLGQYAIGGAVGATPYLEPAATPGCGHFCDTASAPGVGCSLSRVRLYGYLEALGGRVPDEPIGVGGWPLQFLPPGNDLEREALAVDRAKLPGKLERHGLIPKRKQFERKYFEGNDRQTGNATEQMV